MKAILAVLFITVFAWADTAFDRGWALANRGNYHEAIYQFTQAIEMNPYYAKAYEARGAAYLGLKNFTQATRDAREACDLGECALLQTMIAEGLISVW